MNDASLVALLLCLLLRHDFRELISSGNDQIRQCARIIPVPSMVGIMLSRSCRDQQREYARAHALLARGSDSGLPSWNSSGASLTA